MKSNSCQPVLRGLIFINRGLSYSNRIYILRGKGPLNNVRTEVFEIVIVDCGTDEDSNALMQFNLCNYIM